MVDLERLIELAASENRLKDENAELRELCRDMEKVILNNEFVECEGMDFCPSCRIDRDHNSDCEIYRILRRAREVLR